jgi:hypothetical protein
MTVLSTYRTQVRRLLKDANGQYWSDTEVNDSINEARRKVVEDTGCLRVIQTMYCMVGVEYYDFGTVTGLSITSGGTGAVNPTITITGGGGSGATATATVASGVITAVTMLNTGSGYTSTPTVTVSSGTAVLTPGVISNQTLDILSLNLIYGGTKYILDYKDFTTLTAYARYLTNWQQPMQTWSMYGQTRLYVGPQPDQTYQIEVDSIIEPNDLIDDTTVEQISPLFQAPIKYYAAHVCKFKQQSYGESIQVYEQQYNKRLDAVQRSIFTRRVGNVYEDPY